MPGNISIVAADETISPARNKIYLRAAASIHPIQPAKRAWEKVESLLRASFANFDFNDSSARVVNRSPQIEF